MIVLSGEIPTSTYVQQTVCVTAPWRWMTPATSSYQPSRLVHDPLERHERQVLDGRGGRPST